MFSVSKHLFLPYNDVFTAKFGDSVLANRTRDIAVRVYIRVSLTVKFKKEVFSCRFTFIFVYVISRSLKKLSI